MQLLKGSDDPSEFGGLLPCSPEGRISEPVSHADVSARVTDQQGEWLLCSVSAPEVQKGRECPVCQMLCRHCILPEEAKRVVLK